MTSDLLGDVLSDQELAQARRHAMYGHDGQLLAVGALARDRLATWAEREPLAFADYFNSQEFGGKRFETRMQGSTFEVNTAEKGWMSWRALVEKGHVRPAPRSRPAATTTPVSLWRPDARFLIKL
jgi:hypothetical protein